MNIKINAAWKPLAALGLALALAGCSGNKGGTTATAGAGSPDGGADTLATVGSTPITRAELTQILEAQSGSQILPVLIDTQLLTQAGKDAGISVTDAEVTAELERLKKENPQIADELTKNPSLLSIINTQSRRNLVSQKLLTKDVKMTDTEVQKFFTEYKSYYQAPGQIKIGRLLTSTKARADAMSRALKDKSKTFEQLVEEQKKAQDQIANSSDMGGDSFFPVDTLPTLVGPDDAKKLENLPKGGNTAPVQLPAGTGESIFVIYHVTDRKAPGKADFATLKPIAETDYKMMQVAKDEVKKNPQNPPFEETLKRTRDALRGQSQDPSAPPPTLRDVLTIILQPLQQNILTDLRSKGTVKIDDPAYTSVADQYKATPTAVPPATTAGAPATGSVAPAANAPAAPPAPANDAAPPTP